MARTAAFLYGAGYSFVLAAPDGWVLDDTSGRTQGVAAVFYPAGSSWKDSIVVMYVKIVRKGPGKETLDQVVRIDTTDFVQASQASTAVEQEPIQTRDKKKGTVKRFHDARNHNEEIVAYIDEAKVVVIIALSSRTKEQFPTVLAPFHDLVCSYYFLSEKTVIQH